MSYPLSYNNIESDMYMLKKHNINQYMSSFNFLSDGFYVFFVCTCVLPE